MNVPFHRSWIASLLLLLVGVPFVGAGEQWLTRNWQSDVGLPDNSVVGIEQTPDGFLWVATKTGLTRFDGVQFRSFPVTVAGAPAGGIKTLAADGRGRLWVAKDFGVVLCVDQGVTSMVVGPETFKDADAGERMMMLDSHDALWVSYSNGAVLRIQDGVARSFTSADGLPGGSSCQLARDGEGQIWFAQGGWVGVFREDKFHPLAQEPLRRIFGARAGGIWGYRDRHLWRFAEGGSLTKFGTLPEEVPDVTPTAMCEDRTGCLWLGTLNAGLFRFDPKGDVSVPLAQQNILTLQEDREGNVWVGTRGGGLNQVKRRVVELLNTGSASQFEPVQSLCQDTDGKLWAIVWPEGRLLRSGGPKQEWITMSPEDGWPNSRSACVAADPNGGVWIGMSDAGMKHWQNGAVTETLDQGNGLATNQVGALLATAGELWIGPRGAEVVQCRRNGQFRTFPLPGGSGSAIALAIDADGDCWVATYGRRLLRVHGDVVKDETSSTLAEPCEIRGLLGTPDGSLWIGYAGQGLGRLKSGRFSQWRPEQGLHDDYICNILPDGRGRLWFAGNRGIFSVREKEFEDTAAKQSTRVRSVTYGRNDGLLRLQANYNFWPGAQRGTDGQLLFAMQSGIAVVSADGLNELPFSPPVVIERVTANGQTVAAYQAGGLPVSPQARMPLELGRAGAHLRLLPDQRRVEFSFTSPTLTKPDIVGFRFRLRPLDRTWVEAGTLRTATYAQIPPGHYQFEVSANDNEGGWNPASTMLEITVEAYWWETAWFRLGAPLAAIGMLAWGILFISRQRQQRQIERLKLMQATERERARIAQDLHDDLGAGLTEIGLLGDLVATDGQDVPQTAQQISQRARELVTALDGIVWAVNPRHDNPSALVAYFCRFAQDFLRPADIACRLEVEEPLPTGMLTTEVRHELFLAFKEALNNVVKHAHATEVRLRIAIAHHQLTVRISDNGRGMTGKASIGSPDGIQGMRERLTRMGGQCEVHSQAGEGVQVNFILPLQTTPL